MKDTKEKSCPPIKIPPTSTPICIIDSSATTSICPNIPNIKNTTTVHTTNTDVTPTNDPKLGPTTNPTPVPQENEMLIDISVDDSNSAFDADDDDDSNKTGYKTNKIRADTVNVNIIKEYSYTEKCNNNYDNIDDKIL